LDWSQNNTHTIITKLVLTLCGYTVAWAGSCVVDFKVPACYCEVMPSEVLLCAVPSLICSFIKKQTLKNFQDDKKLKQVFSVEAAFISIPEEGPTSLFQCEVHTDIFFLTCIELLITIFSPQEQPMNQHFCRDFLQSLPKRKKVQQE